MNTISIIETLRRECDIIDPARKNGYLTALLDVQSRIGEQGNDD